MPSDVEPDTGEEFLMEKMVTEPLPLRDPDQLQRAPARIAIIEPYQLRTRRCGNLGLEPRLLASGHRRTPEEPPVCVPVCHRGIEVLRLGRARHNLEDTQRLLLGRLRQPINAGFETKGPRTHRHVLGDGTEREET